MSGEVVSDGTVFGSAEWYDNRWAALTAEQRELIVTFLRIELKPSMLDKTRELHAEDPEDWASVYHFTTGMGVRNLLRRVLPDNELPLAPYPNGTAHSNWDDYYVQALEAAAGVR